MELLALLTRSIEALSFVLLLNDYQIGELISQWVRSFPSRVLDVDPNPGCVRCDKEIQKLIADQTFEDLVTTQNGMTISRALVNVVIDQQIGQQISVCFWWNGVQFITWWARVLGWYRQRSASTKMWFILQHWWCDVIQGKSLNISSRCRIYLISGMTGERKHPKSCWNQKPHWAPKLACWIVTVITLIQGLITDIQQVIQVVHQGVPNHWVWKVTGNHWRLPAARLRER